MFDLNEATENPEKHVTLFSKLGVSERNTIVAAEAAVQPTPDSSIKSISLRINNANGESKTRLGFQYDWSINSRNSLNLKLSNLNFYDEDENVNENIGYGIGYQHRNPGKVINSVYRLSYRSNGAGRSFIDGKFTLRKNLTKLNRVGVALGWRHPEDNDDVTEDTYGITPNYAAVFDKGFRINLPMVLVMMNFSKRLAFRCDTPETISVSRWELLIPGLPTEE